VERTGLTDGAKKSEEDAGESSGGNSGEADVWGNETPSKQGKLKGTQGVGRQEKSGTLKQKKRKRVCSKAPSGGA